MRGLWTSVLRPRAGPPLHKHARCMAGNAELVVILMCVGAAFSNMFVARRFQSFQHMKAPRGPETNHTSHRHEGSRNYDATSSDENSAFGSKAKKRQLEEELREHNIAREYKRIWNLTDGSGLEARPTTKYLPPLIVSSLRILDLPHARAPTREEVKRQHRILALKLHPDTSSSINAAEHFKELQKIF